jgi:hypothetical protein
VGSAFPVIQDDGEPMARSYPIFQD